MKYIKSTPYSLKHSSIYDEKWLQGVLAEDESLLGLGEIMHIESERRQNNGGRLDLMFQDESGEVRYCVELQLGATDEAHLIRTLEYWDNERSRNPHIEHIAVIVAEDITTRFLNVISLFNKSVPLIAIQLNAIEVDGNIALVAVKVLDIAQNIGWEDDSTSSKVVTDRSYWERKATPQTVKFADTFLSFVKEVSNDQTLELKYNKYYIGLAHNGIPDNFMTFKPRKQGMVVAFKLARTDELFNRIEESLDYLSYNPRWSECQVKFSETDFAANKDLVSELIKLAKKMPISGEADNT
jgi:hypothetical protein